MNSSLPSYPEALNTLNDAMRFAASRDTFEIHKGTLYSGNGKSEEVYLVALRGTNQSFDKNDVLGIPVVMKAFFNKGNIYFDVVKKAILDTIPFGSSLILIGHSLGGMILQQISSDREIKARYTLLNLLNIGSPFVKVTGRECPFYRFADKADVIPWLGFSVKANLKTHKPVFKSNGYLGNPLGAHTDSYRQSESWMEYDCFGILRGGHTFVF